MLNNNYGHAIVPFIQYVISDMEEVKSTLLRVQRKIDRELNLTQRERNWSAMVAANITAGLVAHKLGLLIKWDMMNIYHHVLPKLNAMRKEVEAPLGGASAVIGAYISKYAAINMLSVDGNVDARGHKAKAPYLMPRGELRIRHEPDTQKMYFPVQEFNKDLMDMQIDSKEFYTELKAIGMYLDTANKRVYKGTRIIAPAVRCLVINCNHPDMMDVEAVIGEAQESADVGGEGSLQD
tara:strand:- start:129 stop:839 length:711 start_codon:yes stop_codon:yes gene_type:complete